MFYIYYKQPANYIQIGEKWKKSVKGHPSRSRDLCFLLRFNAKIKLEWMRLKETLIQSSRRLGCTSPLHLCWLRDFNSSCFFFPLSWLIFILLLHFIWIVFLLQPLPRMTPIQREREMMSVPRLSGCNQLWLVAAATFWEEHIKVLLLGVRVGETGWGGGNYTLIPSLLTTLGGEVHAF